MRRKRIVLLISSGWAVRNYVRSGALERLRGHADVTVFLPAAASDFAAELTASGVDVETLPPPSAGKPLATLMSILTHAHNRRFGLWHATMWRWATGMSSRWKRPFLEVIRFASIFVARNPLYRAVARMQERALRDHPRVRACADLLERIGADLVVSTNVFNLGEIFVSAAARRSGIQSVGSIISWDNLSYLGYPAAEYSHYLVWSPIMREELLRMDPRVSADRITMVGSPQFDFHLDESLALTRQDLFEQIGADPDRPLITYAAGTPEAFGGEDQVVEAIWQRIRDGAIEGNPQLHVRVHPHDWSDRFDVLAARCPGLLISRPWPYDPKRIWWFTPDREEIGMLSNTLRHSDVTVTVFSSVVLDAAVANRPCVCIAFSIGPDTPSMKYIKHSLENGHCRYISASGVSPITHTLDQLIGALNTELRGTVGRQDARREVAARICGPVGGASDRIVDALLERLAVPRVVSRERAIAG